MDNKQKLKKVINNLSQVESIKLVNSDVYYEYDVIVLYKNGSEVFSCESSEESTKIYNFLQNELNKIKDPKPEEKIF